MENLPQQWKEGEGACAYFWNMPYMASQSLYDVEYFVSVVTWLSFLCDWVGSFSELKFAIFEDITYSQNGTMAGIRQGSYIILSAVLEIMILVAKLFHKLFFASLASNHDFFHSFSG